MVDRLARRFGITKRISPQSLRHFITAALNAGVPLRDVREAASQGKLNRSAGVGG